MATKDKRVDVGDVTLMWGDPTRAKVELREESLRRHLELPVGERLAAALELVLRHDERACLSRAVSAKVDDVEVRVVTAEDLLIHKMIKLRTDRRRMLQDLADIRAVMEARRADLDWSYLATWLQPSDESLLRAMTSETDEDIARRLLGMPQS